MNGQRFLLAERHRYRIIPTGQTLSLILIPKQRLRLSVTVPLTGKPTLDQCVQDRLDIMLESDGSDEDFFDRLGRWSRLTQRLAAYSLSCYMIGTKPCSY